MTREQFLRYLRECAWQNLFISGMRWNNPKENERTNIPITIDDTTYQINYVAHRNGFKVLTCAVEERPSMSLCRRLDTQLRTLAPDYLCIFTTSTPMHHCWVCPVKSNERRELVIVEYSNEEQCAFLQQKIDGFTFSIDQKTTITEVRERVHNAFAVNAERITKEFYRSFTAEHKAFATLIEGIESLSDRQWYTSVMLNRLMFCYFIQKKGFFDGNRNYLGDKLRMVQAEKGKGNFYSFYRGFLTHFFHDGLNAPNHTTDWERRYGRIPYLNGGMFDKHLLEQTYPDIDIRDEAFERLFAFFDRWQWHLDTRITASGRDINPDVLGYIFEQYINDRAAMGAYYTKEDITEYIAKNCIIPFLFNRMAQSAVRNLFTTDGEVWQLLRNSGTRYLYDAVCKGYSPNWRTELPPEIAVGLSTTEPELLARRAQWNTHTSDHMALPTEIWRETIERLMRTDEIVERIAAGEVNDIDQFITYNLDIRQFTLDLLTKTDNHLLIRHFYKALREVTILDPTCGSGAFLFAAMNILEPLYEVCIYRMQEFHKQNPNLFKEELAEIEHKYRSNIQYFIHKNIILDNLYGVDIMREAIEIAKLRLFLKMVAVVEVDRRSPNLGLDPLPDIDFNIRCGNTLVGYATAQELNEHITYHVDAFSRQEFEKQVNEGMEKVAIAYKTFKDIQTNQEDKMAEFKVAKLELYKRLGALNDSLNHLLYGCVPQAKDYDQWLVAHQPFHWLAEFYEIVHEHGGFDVIIGNPPYVEFPSKEVQYKLEHLKTKKCGNLYGCCIERGTILTHAYSLFGFIIPVAITCSERMEPAIKKMKEISNKIYFSNFDDRPGKLFDKLQHLRASIFIAHKGDNTSLQIFATKYNRWYTSCRPQLFDTLRYVNVTSFSPSYVIAKHSYDIECAIRQKMNILKKTIGHYCLLRSNNKVYYRKAGGGYFILVKDKKSITYINGELDDVKAEGVLHIRADLNNTALGGVISSNLFYWFYIASTDCRNLTLANIHNFACPISCLTDRALIDCATKLFKDYEKNSIRKETYYKSTQRNVVYFEYHQKLSKPILDEIDTILAKHYGFTDEELDYIINYDIKYRMGDELADD